MDLINKTANKKIAIIGIGYVGLPLAIEFSKKFEVLGFDINQSRTENLRDAEHIRTDKGSNETHFGGSLTYTSDINDIADCDIYIITVPTPIDNLKKPDLSQLLEASRMVGTLLKPSNIVIFESTVYPGCTEEDCVPILEEFSNLKYNVDFFCGYSPERINVGDSVNTLTQIVKVTSGSTPQTATEVDLLYASIILAGTYKVSSIKIAEASKAIENAQRDLNISFVNELAFIFDKMNIDTNEVIDAAATKWNFMKFKPGLVGGHCIGVDPYYLTFKSEQLGYKPEVILSGRRVNENVPNFIVDKVLSLINQKGRNNRVKEILVLGYTFKENCDDIRNSRVLDLYNAFKSNNCKVELYDPWVNIQIVDKEYYVPLIPEINYGKKYDAIVLAVAHHIFEKIDFQHFKNDGAIIYDIKSFLPKALVDGRL